MGAKPNPDLARSLNNVGLAYENLEMYGEAKQYYEEGLQLSKKMDAAHRSYFQQFTQALGRLVNKFHAAAVKACKAGDEAAINRIYWGAFEKDLRDTQGNPLICWMAQHEMVITMEPVLNLGWDPNLSNTSGVYPLHYGAVKNPTLTKALLDAGAHPFVQTPKGTTPAQAARSKGQVTTLALLLPHTSEFSFTDAATFEASYEAYVQASCYAPSKRRSATGSFRDRPPTR